MKSSMTTLMIAAAALAVAAGSASAQTYKAEIPLTFRAGEKLMVAGSYEFQVQHQFSGVDVFYLRNTDNNARALVMGRASGDTPAEWKAQGKPTLGFACADEHCVLTTFWDGHDASTYKLPGSITPHADRQVAAVVVTLAKTE